MKIPNEIRKKLHAYPNVETVGWGKKYKDGKFTGEYAICVGVTQKMSVSALAKKELLPKEINGILVDVQETGKIETKILKPDINRTMAVPQEFNAKYRPAPGGCSIAHFAVTAGTLGCLVQKENKLCILTNNHVGSNANNAKFGDAWFQPAPYDNGTENDIIATLLEFVPIRYMGEAPAPNPGTCKGSTLLKRVLDWIFAKIGSKQEVFYKERPYEVANLVDCALGHVVDAKLVTPEILKIGLIKGVLTETYIGMPVRKSGRTTEYTEGEIIQTEVSSRVDYGEGRIGYFEDQLMAGAMCAGGDSGSAILTMDNYIVGLLFAGSEQTTIINKIQNVINALKIERFVDAIA